MSDVDIVITWVDGADPVLEAKREHYLTHSRTPLHNNGTNPHRWICSDELHFCLRSIAHNAPWVRRIWIVTDGQIPVISGLPSTFDAKITIVDHQEIFAGFQSNLPTFNSLSIETMLWRIAGLSEHFLYFNDDVFLTSRVEVSDFFTDCGPVLRGKWVDYAYLRNSQDNLDDASLLNHFNQIKSAGMIGYGADHIFASAHVVHPMQRSIMAVLQEEHSEQFLLNSAYRFRCTDQFLPQSLHNHYCLKKGLGRVQVMRDYLHIGVGALDDWSESDVHDFLNSAERNDIKFLCINDLPEVERNFPQARSWISEAISS